MNLTPLFILLLLVSALWSQQISDYQGNWGIDPTGTALANGQPDPQLSGASLNQAQGMFVEFDGTQLTLNIMGMRKSSQCTDIQVSPQGLTMKCTADQKVDDMTLSLKNQQLWMSKASDSTYLIFDSLTPQEYQQRLQVAIDLLQQMQR